MVNSEKKRFQDEIIDLWQEDESSNNLVITLERYRETIRNVKEVKLSFKNRRHINDIS